MKINYKKIWTEIGDAFATPFEDKTAWEKRITCVGLCSAFLEILERDYPSENSKWREDNSYDPINALGCSMGIDSYMKWWTYGKHDSDRATFAYFMAAMGNKGYAELIKAVTK